MNGLQPFAAVDIAHAISKSIRTIAAFFLSTAALGASNKPNVVFILADDLGYGDLSHAGGRARTPHCDRLARRSLECGGKRSTTPLLPHPIQSAVRFALAAHSNKKRPGTFARPLVCVLLLVKPTKLLAHGAGECLRLIRRQRQRTVRVHILPRAINRRRGLQLALECHRQCAIIIANQTDRRSG